MPARDKKQRRRPYRPDQAQTLERLETKRRRLEVTVAELAARANIGERTLRRIQKTGRAFPRHIRALTFALRSLENERRDENRVLE